jgi:hypothetical protein
MQFLVSNLDPRSLIGNVFETPCSTPGRLLGTRLINAISCFEPGPQELYREIFLNPL